MTPIKWITAVFKEWRQKVYDMQYQDGYDWARKTYFEGRLPIKELLEAALPVTGAFDRGVLQAVIDIERDKAARIEVNQVGEPVNVPFFIHPSNLPPARSEEEELYYIDPHIEAINALRRQRQDPIRLRMVSGPEIIDPEKEKAAAKVEEDMGLRPRTEQVDVKSYIDRIRERGINVLPVGPGSPWFK